MLPLFRNEQESHQHSLITLNELYEHDDFMESVGRVVDLGCGPDALDAKWWATRTTRDDNALPLNIQCLAVDNAFDSLISREHGVSFQRTDIETWTETKRQFDLLWCHNVFQYLTNPLTTLRNWWYIAEPGAMLIIILPDTVTIDKNQLAFDLPTGNFYHHSMTSLIYMLAVNGWDCASGAFKKKIGDPWLYSAVYKSAHAPMDPRSTSWYKLAELSLLPDSAAASITKNGYLRQRDLVLPWIDKSLTWMGQQ